jgi:hypothetical protein
VDMPETPTLEGLFEVFCFRCGNSVTPGSSGVYICDGCNTQTCLCYCPMRGSLTKDILESFTPEKQGIPRKDWTY